MRWGLILPGALVGAYLLVLLALFLAQRSLIYPAPRDQIDVAVAGMDRVLLRSADGLVLRAAYSPSRSGRRTLVFFHGNGDGLIGADQATRLLRRAGYGLLLVEYRGYGGNAGTATERGLALDGRAALDWLAARGIAGRQVVLIGNSLGSGVACGLAAERNVGGLVLVSPFTSMADVAHRHIPYVPVRWLLRDRYDNLARLRGRHLPLLVLHGRSDRLIPASQGADLAAAIPDSRLVLVPGVGHELAYTDLAQREIIGWLERLAD